MDARWGYVSRFNVSRETFARLEHYADTLVRWQARINLIAPSQAGDLWRRHICDGLQIIDLLPDKARTIVDLGSGAGVPGLVIALALADRSQPPTVHLVESNGKKAAFLSECVRASGVNALVHRARIETFAAARFAGNCDVVTARALAPLPKLITLAAPLLINGAVGLFHKGQHVDAELTETTKYWNITPCKHPSRMDKGGCILEIRGCRRAGRV